MKKQKTFIVTFKAGAVEPNENCKVFNTEKEADAYVLDILKKYELKAYNEALANGDTDPEWEEMVEWLLGNTELAPDVDVIVE